MESTGIFEKTFFKLLREDNIAGAGGSLGGGAGFDPEAGEINSSDWYAPGDARNPTPSGRVQTRKGVVGSKKKKKKKKKEEVYLPGEDEEISEEEMSKKSE